MIAAVTVPNMRPMIKIDIVFLTLLAAKRTANNTIAAPRQDAIAIDQLDNAKLAKNPPNILEPKIRIATPKLAPEEIPNTKGPAKGFLKRVCINNPAIDKPEPTSKAVIAFGSRKFNIITSQLDLELSPPKSISNTSEIGMETDPIFILKKKRIMIAIDKPINCLVYVF